MSVWEYRGAGTLGVVQYSLVQQRNPWTAGYIALVVFGSLVTFVGGCLTSMSLAAAMGHPM